MQTWTDYETAGLKAFIMKKKPLAEIYEVFSHRSVPSVQMKIRELTREIREERYKEKISILQARVSTVTALYNSYKVENRSLKKEIEKLKDESSTEELRKLGYKLKVEVSK